MTGTDAVERRVDERFDGYLESLFSLLSTPSVSATGEGMEECPELVADLCSTYGFDDSRVVDTDGYPAVISRAYVDHVAENEFPTLLIYGHYDVQPVDPDEWQSPPFVPTVRTDASGDERIYARGAGDNKGQFFAHVCAVDALRAEGGIPLNITLLLEGEEESGSQNLQAAVRENGEILEADLVFNADGPMERNDHPEVNLGTRGLLYFEITAEGPDRDLHSGNFGGPVPNPLWAIVDLLNSMKGEDGSITVDGFYDDVADLTAEDYGALEDIPFEDESLLEATNSDGLADGPGNSYYEKLMFHPSVSIAGIHGGYAGERAKTAIPATATAKLDLRLVENQDPGDIYGLFEDHVETHASDKFSWKMLKIGSVNPLRISLDAPFREPVVNAVTDVWGQKPIVKPSAGGAGPYHVFYEELGLPYIAVPYANFDEQNHSPNENLKVSHFESGIRCSIRIFRNLGATL
ncbi:M20/M25/M40 family metallo-hydrolase [Halorubrum trueperi]|uniref:M20/M25/M40 family metallo-hydrolase n=1 Tax=Halorubrum trueperi TaxID=2004704 RepID=A0ABD5UJU1_9EURY